MSNAGKPLTFAAMLVRAQRRFAAMGKPFPCTSLPQIARAWPGAQATGHEAAAGQARLNPSLLRSAAGA